MADIPKLVRDLSNLTVLEAATLTKMLKEKWTGVGAPPRKFLSEFAVNLLSARWIMVTPSDLMSGGEINQQSAEVAQHCHIYLICRRPAVGYDPDSFRFDGARIEGRLNYKAAGQTESLPFGIPFELVDGATAVRLSSYPHRDIETLRPDGEIVRHLPASVMATAVAPPGVLRQLEVLYVGQAYADGRRSALDRLKSHSTLQKILADVVQKMPDDEILLLTFEYAPYRVITTMDGTDKTAISDPNNAKRFPDVLDNPLSEHQQICLVEAGLIRYFKPSYNEIYRDSFPASDQKILSSCYELDFSALVVEINTDEYLMELFSRHASAATHHIAKFNLIDPTVRRSFFTFLNKEGKAVDFPGVISPTR